MIDFNRSEDFQIKPEPQKRQDNRTIPVTLPEEMIKTIDLYSEPRDEVIRKAIALYFDLPKVESVEKETIELPESFLNLETKVTRSINAFEQLAGFIENQARRNADYDRKLEKLETVFHALEEIANLHEEKNSSTDRKLAILEESFKSLKGIAKSQSEQSKIFKEQIQKIDEAVFTVAKIQSIEKTKG